MTRYWITLLLIVVLASKPTDLTAQILAPILTQQATVVNLFFGDGCAGTTTNTCTQEGQSQSGLTANSVAAQFTTGSNVAGYDVKACGVLLNAIDGTNPQINCAIYSGASGSTTKVCTATEVTATVTIPTWQENTTFSGCTLSASTAYVVAIQFKGSSTAIRTNSAPGNLQGFISSTYGTFPGTATWIAGFIYSLYARVTPL